MDKGLVVRLHSSFEAMVQTDPQSEFEFWCARDLQMLLEDSGDVIHNAMRRPGETENRLRSLLTRPLLSPEGTA